MPPNSKPSILLFAVLAVDCALFALSNAVGALSQLALLLLTVLVTVVSFDVCSPTVLDNPLTVWSKAL